MQSQFKKLLFPKIELNTTLFLLLTLCLVAPFALEPFYDEIRLATNWRGVFDDYQDIGGNCRVAFRPTGGSFSQEDMLKEGRVNAVPYLVPFRAEPKYTAVPEKNWVYVSCEVEAKDTQDWIGPLIYLGPIWGSTSVYIDGKLRRQFPSLTYATVPLQRDEVAKKFILEMVSLNTSGNAAGPMSLIPIVLLPSDPDLRAIERDLNYYRTEKTLVPLGIAGTMMLLFICCWLFGVRYRDVYWMTVASAAAAGSAALYHYPIGDAPMWRDRIAHLVDVICWASFCVAIYTFLRKKASQTTLILVVIGTAAAYQLQWAVPAPIRKSLIGGIGRHDGIVIGIVLMVLAYFAYKVDEQIPKRRHLQRTILAFMLFTLGAFVLWTGIYGHRVGLSLDSLTRTVLVGLFGTFMIIDLVVFQRAYFEEKSLKEEEERRRSALEERMELGFSIQKLLMPKELKKDYGPFRVQVFYECAEKMAGDWFYWRDTGPELRVLCGDVVGKGPEAAIAATSILTICHDFTKSEPTMESFLSRLNTTVSDLFRNTSISTVGGIVLTLDGQARVFNHGFAGWLKIIDGVVDVINQRGPSLGANGVSEWNGVDVGLNTGDRLVIFSDGVVEGPRALKKISELLSHNRRMSIAETFQLILEAGKSSVVDDDRTIVIVERIT